MIDLTAYQAIFLWRHADAEPITISTSTDIQRELTVRGSQQAQQMAMWLANQLPEAFTVLSSPAKRTLQTAQTLGQQVTIVDQFAPGASLFEILNGLRHALPNTIMSQHIIIVGHQSWIGQLANYLESHASLLAESTFSVADRSFKKAEVLCFRKPLATPSALFELYQSQTPEID